MDTTISSTPATSHDKSTKHRRSALRLALDYTTCVVVGALCLLYYVLINCGMLPLYLLENLSDWLLGRNNRLGMMCRRGVLVLMRMSSLLMVLVVERYAGMQVQFSGDRVLPYENGIMIANHVTSVDFLAIKTGILRCGMLRHVKFLAKSSLRWVPGLGWGMLLSRQIMIHRRWDSDRRSIEQTFSALQGGRWPLMMCIFLEGTRATKEKLQQSRKFAREAGLPELHRVMYPRTRGFLAAARQLSQDGYVKHVYDLTFGYCNAEMDDVDADGDSGSRRGPLDALTLFDLLGRGPGGCKGTKLCIDVRRHRLEDLPLDDDEQLKQWCFEQWQRKDRLLTGLYSRQLNPSSDPMQWHFPDREIRHWPIDVKEATDDTREPYRRQFAALREVEKKENEQEGKKHK